MTRKRRRLYFLLIGMAALGAAAALVLSAFRDNLVFFYTPSELLAKQPGPDRRVRIGGLVGKGSVVKEPDGLTVTFRITDMEKDVPVKYGGTLPDLFREGQGVVAEGTLGSDGIFAASEVLAKHDEKYMPPEVVQALKKSGRWQENEKTAPVMPPS